MSANYTVNKKEIFYLLYKDIDVEKIRTEEILVPYRLLHIQKSNPITKSKL